MMIMVMVMKTAIKQMLAIMSATSPSCSGDECRVMSVALRDDAAVGVMSRPTKDS